MENQRFLCGIFIYIAALTAVEGLRCLTCENARSIEECDRIGKIKTCNGAQDACGIEVRHHGGWKYSNIKVFKYCKQKSACSNVQNQNSDASWYENQCNPKFPNSVCRCCCFDDRCNIGDLQCFNEQKPLKCVPIIHPPKYASVECTNTSHPGSNCSIKCEKGFFMKGEPVLTCLSDMKWSSKVPSCVSKICPSLDGINNGYFNCNNHNKIGSVCRYNCKKGYRLKGLKTTVCQENSSDSKRGTWSTSVQTCERVGCLHYQNAPKYGSISCSDGKTSGSICEFKCDQDYDLVGDDSVECKLYDEAADWYGTAPKCELKTCKNLQYIKNGFSKCSNEYLLGTTCVFYCEDDYDVIGAKQTTCKKSRGRYATPLWDNDVPKCKRIECLSHPETPVNGYMVCSSEKYIKSTCKFNCDQGYNIVGEIKTKCDYTYDGKTLMWSHKEPTCERKQCQQILPAPANGMLHCTDGNNLDSRCRFSCDGAFYLEKEVVSVCEETKGYGLKWSKESPVCKRKQCTKFPTAPANGEIRCSDEFYIGSVCKFTCEPEYYRQGYQITACVEDYIYDELMWDNETPLCIRKECPLIPKVPENGKFTCNDQKFLGSVCTFSCDSLFKIEGSYETTCVEDEETKLQTWENESPKCVHIECETLPIVPEHSAISCSKGKLIGSICSFECDSEYELIGAVEVTCGEHKDEYESLKTPIWDYEVPTCIRKRCEVPTASSSGSLVCTDDYFINSLCEYACDEFYKRVGPLYTKCAEDYYGNMKWTNPTPPVCELITCPVIPEIKFGEMNCSDGVHVNSECNFRCTEEDYNFSPHMSESIKCQNDSTWSDRPPCCSRSCPPYAVMDLVVVLDSSSSIGAKSWKVMLNFINNLFDLFVVKKDAMNFGVVRYNRHIDNKTQINLNDCPDDVEELKNEVANLPYNGAGTWTGQAMKHVLENMLSPSNGNRPKVLDVVLVVTDGRSQDDVNNPAEALRARGVLTFALGITPNTGKLNLDQLQEIAGDKSRLLLAESGFNNLTPEFAQEISKYICGDPCDRYYVDE